VRAANRFDRGRVDESPLRPVQLISRYRQGGERALGRSAPAGGKVMPEGCNGSTGITWRRQYSAVLPLTLALVRCCC